ncbi:MAG: hypothetical protein JXJ22_01490 [Bacteroidales bacterium]|nr:hypothetical protein [Bacteroidales bacterium]
MVFIKITIPVIALIFQTTNPLNFNQFVKNLKTSSEPERHNIISEYLTAQKTFPAIEQDSLVHFIWYGKTNNVLLKGDINRNPSLSDSMEILRCGSLNFFYKTLIIPKNARLNYWFEIDGKKVLDPGNTRIIIGKSGKYSELAMPGFTSSESLVYNPEIKHGKIDSFIFKSSNDLIKARKIKVFLPSGYDTLSFLPTVYVHDGDEALKLGLYINVLDNLIAEGKIRPVLAVFIPPVDRQSEYLWTKLNRYSDAICNELVPFIDRHYATSPLPKHRGIIGIAEGGHIALYTALHRYDIFQNTASQSAVISTRLSDELFAISNNPYFPSAMKIYMDAGRYDLVLNPGKKNSVDYLKQNREFSDELYHIGIQHIYNEYNDGHSWANWRQRAEEILGYFFGVY